MSPQARCAIAVRLIGILIAGLSFSQTWHAAHTMFFNRIYFGLYTEWLWPFYSYDPEALDDLGQLILFALALILIFRANFVSRLVMRGFRSTGQCPDCGYNVRGLKAPTCPECGAALPAEPIH